MYYYGLSDLSFWAAVAVGQVAFWFAMSPLIRALAARIRGPLGAGYEDRIEALELAVANTAHTDSVGGKVRELEDRLNFAERLLAQGRENARIEEAR
jgi:hypothetical protein